MKSKQAIVLAATALFALRVPINADTLFRGRDPVRIGKGVEAAGKISWSDCDGSNKATFDKPPYVLDKADNCSVGAPTFGLECSGERCTVIDETKLRRYLPGVRNG